MKKKMNVLIYYSSCILGWTVLIVFEVSKLLRLNYFTDSLSVWIVSLFDSNVIELRQEYDPLERREITKAILALPSYGCDYYYKKGGCAMCGFNHEIDKYGFRYMHPRAMIALTTVWMKNLEVYILRQKCEIDVLAIFMAGSFLNSAEVPLLAQNLVFACFKLSSIKRLIVESRPEYITRSEQRLNELTRGLSDKKLEIAIGFEAVNDKIRNIDIHKSISIGGYREAIKSIKRIGAIATTYVLLGAPGLSDEQVAQEAIETAMFSWESGSDLVNIETYCVQADTIWHKLYLEGKLTVPTLWCVINVIISLQEISDYWRLGKFSDWPKPIASPGACECCYRDITRILNVLRKTHNQSGLLDLAARSCAPKYIKT